MVGAFQMEGQTHLKSSWNDLPLSWKEEDCGIGLHCVLPGKIVSIGIDSEKYKKICSFISEKKGFHKKVLIKHFVHSTCMYSYKCPRGIALLKTKKVIPGGLDQKLNKKIDILIAYSQFWLHLAIFPHKKWEVVYIREGTFTKNNMVSLWQKMDGWVRVLYPFNSISVISRRWEGEHERLCAMKRRLGSGRISPPAGFEPATPWSKVGSANRSATRTLRQKMEKDD